MMKPERCVAVLLALAACAAAGRALVCEFEGQLLPNALDCRSFFQCSHGRLYLQRCPAGLTYNPLLQRCDFPSDEDLCLDDGVRAACPPPGDDDLTVQLPNPDDCGSFFKCDLDGNPVLLACPPGLEYNAALEICDYPQDAGCSTN